MPFLIVEYRFVGLAIVIAIHWVIGDANHRWNVDQHSTIINESKIAESKITNPI